MSLRALAHLRGHTKAGRPLCPAVLRGWPAREPPSSSPQPEVQPGAPDLFPQTPSSCPQGQSYADLSLPESPGVPSSSSPLAPGKPNRPQHLDSCRPSKLPLSTPGQPVPAFWKPFDMQRPDISLPANSGVGEGKKGPVVGCGQCVCSQVHGAITHMRLWLCAGPFSPLSVPEPMGMGTFSFPFSSNPALLSLGTCSSSALETGSCQCVHLSALAAAATPQPPPLPTSGIAPGSCKALTEQQWVGGREYPVKPDSTR